MIEKLEKWKKIWFDRNRGSFCIGRKTVNVMRFSSGGLAPRRWNWSTTLLTKRPSASARRSCFTGRRTDAVTSRSLADPVPKEVSCTRAATLRCGDSDPIRTAGLSITSTLVSWIFIFFFPSGNLGNDSLSVKFKMTRQGSFYFDDLVSGFGLEFLIWFRLNIATVVQIIKKRIPLEMSWTRELVTVYRRTFQL